MHCCIDTFVVTRSHSVKLNICKFQFNCTTRISKIDQTLPFDRFKLSNLAQMFLTLGELYGLLAKTKVYLLSLIIITFLCCK